jgi:hypothetical protein
MRTSNAISLEASGLQSHLLARRVSAFCLEGFRLNHELLFRLPRSRLQKVVTGLLSDLGPTWMLLEIPSLSLHKCRWRDPEGCGPGSELNPFCVRDPAGRRRWRADMRRSVKRAFEPAVLVLRLLAVGGRPCDERRRPRLPSPLLAQCPCLRHR